jgi:hypothetical protein
MSSNRLRDVPSAESRSWVLKLTASSNGKPRNELVPKFLCMESKRGSIDGKEEASGEKTSDSASIGEKIMVHHVHLGCPIVPRRRGTCPMAHVLDTHRTDFYSDHIFVIYRRVANFLSDRILNFALVMFLRGRLSTAIFQVTSQLSAVPISILTTFL